MDLHSSLDVLVSFSEATVPWRCWCEPDMKRTMDSWELQGCFVARCICRGPRCAQFNQPKVWEAANWCTIFIYFHGIHSLMIRYMQRWKVQVTQTAFRMQDALTWCIWWRAHWEQWQPGKCMEMSQMYPFLSIHYIMHYMTHWATRIGPRFVGCQMIHITSNHNLFIATWPSPLPSWPCLLCKALKLCKNLPQAVLCIGRIDSWTC